MAAAAAGCVSPANTGTTIGGSEIEKKTAHKTAHQTISDDLLFAFVKPAMCNKTHLISVGSGTGSHEQKLMTRLKLPQSSVICVDPNSQSPAVIRPHFAGVKELVQGKSSDSYSNSCVLIHWPDPAGENDGYDLAAVSRLLPASVVIVYSKNGTSGSGALTEWIKAVEENPKSQKPVSTKGPQAVYRCLVAHSEKQYTPSSNRARLLNLLVPMTTELENAFLKMDADRHRTLDVVLLARKGSMIDMQGVRELRSLIKKENA